MAVLSFDSITFPPAPHSVAQCYGLGPLQLHPDPLEPRRESRTGLYRLIPAWHRPMGMPSVRGPTNERLHPSVLTRYRADPSWRPVNLVDYFRRFPAEPADQAPPAPSVSRPERPW